jgi:uncharacterized protein YbcI
MPQSDGSPGPSAIEQDLADELLRIHRESYGRGAGSARVYQLGDAVVCLLDDVELLPNEEFLISEGHGSAVVEIRGRYQQAIETTFRAAVERATGRRVISFVSATRLSPAWTIEVFRLGSESPNTLEEPNHG